MDSNGTHAVDKACVAGVQRGGRGKLNASAKRDRWILVGNYENPTIAHVALGGRIQLPSSLPLYAGDAG